MKKKDLTHLLALIPFLENNPGISQDALARRLGCAEGDLMELLNKVLMCGSPPYLPDDYIGFVLDREGIHLTYAAHFSRPIGLTLQEALSVMVLLKGLGLSTEGSLAQASASLREKLVEAIGQKTGQDLDAVASRMAVARGSSVRGEIVALLQRAIVDRTELTMEYYSANSDRTGERRVRPYGLVENTGDLYLVAYCMDNDAVRTFRLDRIKVLEDTGQVFPQPSDLDLEAYRLEGFSLPDDQAQSVEIRLRGEAADWAREAVEGASLTEDADGVILRLKSSSPEWVTRFCLKFGADAELLSPGPMRERTTDIIQKIRAQYD